MNAESNEWKSKYYDMLDNYHNANEEISRLNNYLKALLKRKNIKHEIEAYTSVLESKGDK